MVKYAVPINFLLFQLCWFGCVLGAARGLIWLGPILVLIFVPLQIFLLTERHKAELMFVLICGSLGFVLESLLITARVYVPAGEETLICPPWMTALWCNFGPLVSISLSWLKGKISLAFVLGALAGPLAWWGGEKLGALTVAPEFIFGYLPLSLVWAVILPTLLTLHTKLVAPRNNSESL